MAKNGIRDILIHISVEQALKRRKCHRSRGKHFISKGEHCLVVRESGGLSSKNYCRSCAELILLLARERLVVTNADLTGGSGEISKIKGCEIVEYPKKPLVDKAASLGVHI